MVVSWFSRVRMRELVARIAAFSLADSRAAASRLRIAPSVSGSLEIGRGGGGIGGLVVVVVEKMEWRVLSCSISMARTTNLSGITGFCTACRRSFGESLSQSMKLHIKTFWSSVIFPPYPCHQRITLNFKVKSHDFRNTIWFLLLKI